MRCAIVLLNQYDDDDVTFAFIGRAVRLSSVRLSSVTVGRHTQRVEVLSNILQHIIAWGLGQLVLKFWALNVKILSLLNSTINLQQHHFGMLRSRSLTVSRIRSY